ncbi:hypothetical protein A1O3_03822 [Capronia epimyces CBS 606.96]|uniref:Amine oxidase domain-containing protein n=1 Tax=Capronia epimyces CBS 606.96 TaxID=1182542 RepID=W9Y313_9EURO|nr:uncharacterized protein A1O3_03822 [Capronia epimyces CBS 606.96]EXJ86868.1 hypothetical protein A1O3_03822 [Capronia epimyces CBS 606.96]
MKMFQTNRLAGAALAGTVIASLMSITAGIDISAIAASDVIHRDVAVIGGGASGAYGAVRLSQLGKSVVVVERKPVLGGHTETYTDPVSGNSTEMGVVAWYDTPTVKNFFASLNVGLKTTDVQRAGFTTLTTIPVDFRTGELVTSIYEGNVTQGLLNYAAQVAKYPYLEDGFNLTYPVPADLLLPFGEFVKKYDIAGAIQVITVFANGIGRILDQLTLYVFKLVSLQAIVALQEGNYQSAVSGKNHEIYEAAQAKLGADALVNSQVLAVQRNATGSGVAVLVNTPTGVKLIKAKKLLLAIPPKLDNLAGFDLDATERALFGQIQNVGYYAAIINDTGIPDAVELRNFGVDSPWNVPALPGPYFIQAANTAGLFSVKYNSPVQISDDQVKTEIVAALNRVKAAGSVNTTAVTTPHFVEYHSHAPFAFNVPAAAIQDGFYTHLYALQGRKNTFWTGAAFHAQDSSKLWEFTEKLLPAITEGI